MAAFALNQPFDLAIVYITFPLRQSFSGLSTTQDGQETNDRCAAVKRLSTTPAVCYEATETSQTPPVSSIFYCPI